ncbi:unnamed protein product [Adineta steineri]|uniref:Uncharacterized protein n=1 Tax=Adineta steineri TaxID=433720 RepID=A0A819H398_9BILA|nr:unnamed protein product [Adineta steineri]
MSCASNVVLVWLDVSIGQPNHYPTLKEAFSKTLHPEWVSSPYPNYTNLYNLIETNFNAKSYSYKSNAIEMYAFSNADDYFHYLQKKNDKRIFVIMSGPSCENFLLKSIENYADVFQNSLEDQRISLYALCGNIVKMKKQLKNNQHHVQILNTETALLARLTNAIGDYFVLLGRKQLHDKTYKSVSQAVKYFCWANTLFVRSNDYEKYTTSGDRISIVDEYITKAKRLLEQVRNDNDDIDQYIAYGDTYMLNDMEITEFDQEAEWKDALTFNESIMAETENNVCPSEYSNTTLSTFVEKKPFEKTISVGIAVFLLKPSFSKETFQNISTILIQLFNKNLMIIQEERDYEQLLKPSDLSFIILSLSTNDDKLLLKKLCSLNPSPSIYLLGSQPTTEKDKEIFFREYHSICDMSNNPNELAVRMAIDAAMKNRILADRYVGKQNNNNAVKNYDQCIEILNRLDDFADQASIMETDRSDV